MGEARVEQVGRKWLLLPLLKIPGACACCALEDTSPVVEAFPVTVRPGGDRCVVAAAGTVGQGAAVSEEDVIEAFVSELSAPVWGWSEGGVDSLAGAKTD